MRKVIIAAALVLVIIAGSALLILQGEKPKEEEEFPYNFTREWLKKGNLWVFDQPPIEYLKEIGATGTTWSVYYGGLNEYDRSYVNTLHRNGFVVCSGPPTVQSACADNEQLIQEACERDIYGDPLRFLGLEQYAMCSNHPLWREFLMKRFEEHVDGGVDAILIDEIGDTGAFCDYCMQAFNSYLAEHYSEEGLRSLFGIENLSSFNYRQYLLQHGATSEWEDPNPKLLLEFYQAKYSARADFIRELIQHTKGYAGRELLIGGNLYGLSPNQQIYVPYLDFAIFEMPIMPEEHEWLDYLRPLPGKHLTTYFLAEAIAPEKPFTAFPDVFDLAKLSEDEWWLWRHWLAEARACGASFLIPYQAYTYGGGSYTLAAEKISSYTKFFTEHPQYYENLERIASVAVLHDLHSTLTNELLWLADLSWRSFQRVGVMLQEAHIPFEVVYRGDGKFVQKRLTLEELRKYGVVIVPRGYDLDEEAQDLLSRYSMLGGRVLKCDELVDDFALVSTLKGMGLDFGLETNASEQLGIVVYRRGDSLLAHLINYEYDRGARDFSDQRNVEVTLTIPEEVSLEGRRLRMVSPDANGMILNFRVEDGKVTFTVPNVHCYSIASFE